MFKISPQIPNSFKFSGKMDSLRKKGTLEYSALINLFVQKNKKSMFGFSLFFFFKTQRTR